MAAVPARGGRPVCWVRMRPGRGVALGWVPQALIGRPAIELIAPADVDRVLAWRTLVLAGEARRNIEVRYLRSDGRLTWMSVDAHPIFDDHANVASVVVSAKEFNHVIAARRASETLAAGSKALLRAQSESGLLKRCAKLPFAVVGTPSRGTNERSKRSPQRAQGRLELTKP